MPLTQDKLHVFLRALLNPSLTAPQLATLFDLNLQDYAKLINSPQIQSALNELTKAIELRNKLLAAPLSPQPSRPPPPASTPTSRSSASSPSNPTHAP